RLAAGDPQPAVRPAPGVGRAAAEAADLVRYRRRPPRPAPCLARPPPRSPPAVPRWSRRMTSPDPPPGRYRHYKGNEYEVLGVARHSETHEELVVYRPLYGAGGLWV